MNRVLAAVPRFVVVWIILFSAIAWWWPAPFLPVGSYISHILGVVMLGMGLTLGLADFRRVFTAPRPIAVGVVAQFAMMPLAGFLIARTLDLPWELAVGLILVGCCPSGTASNVMAYLAGADVALSVTVTAINTMLAPLLTPLLLKLFAGQYVEVEALQMFQNILYVVVLPVAAGVAINMLLPRAASRLAIIAPVISVAGIVVIVAFIVARNSGAMAVFAPLLVAAVLMHNAVGYASGYWLGRLARLPERQCRTLAFEIGIQNSALDIQLATKFYAAHKAMTLPGALFSLLQNITGPALAAWWRRTSDHGAVATSDPILEVRQS